MLCMTRIEMPFDVSFFNCNHSMVDEMSPLCPILSQTYRFLIEIKSSR